MIYLTAEQVLFIHHQVVNQFGGLHGVRDIGGLESAVYRPQTTVFGGDAYNTAIDKAAAMLQSLILNHPFHDGNKRTGFAATGIFLALNRVRLIGDLKEIEDFIVRIADQHLSVESISEWLAHHTKIEESDLS